jgi:hypothetical protein
MKHISSKANRSWAKQEIPCILRNPRVNSHIKEINQIHAALSQFLKIHFNIILTSKPRSSKWLPSLGVPNQNSVFTSTPYVLYALAHQILLNFVTQIIFCEEYVS